MECNSPRCTRGQRGCGVVCCWRANGGCRTRKTEGSPEKPGGRHILRREMRRDFPGSGRVARPGRPLGGRYGDLGVGPRRHPGTSGRRGSDRSAAGLMEEGRGGGGKGSAGGRPDGDFGTALSAAGSSLQPHRHPALPRLRHHLRHTDRHGLRHGQAPGPLDSGGPAGHARRRCCLHGDGCLRSLCIFGSRPPPRQA